MQVKTKPLTRTCIANYKIMIGNLLLGRKIDRHNDCLVK